MSRITTMDAVSSGIASASRDINRDENVARICLEEEDDQKIVRQTVQGIRSDLIPAQQQEFDIFIQPYRMRWQEHLRQREQTETKEFSTSHARITS